MLRGRSLQITPWIELGCNIVDAKKKFFNKKNLILIFFLIYLEN
jgi:hypothetical protein